MWTRFAPAAVTAAAGSGVRGGLGMSNSLRAGRLATGGSPLRSCFPLLSRKRPLYCIGSTSFSTDSKDGKGSDRDRILAGLVHNEDSPSRRKLSLDAKLRMLRVMDNIYDSDKDAAMHDKFIANVGFGSDQSVGFDEFLLADKDGDGRVSSAEWEKFLQEKAMVDSGMDYRAPQALNIEVPMSTDDLHRMAADNEGLHISINGMRYKLRLTPEGKTTQIIAKKSGLLHETLQQLKAMEVEKRPLDAKAARHTKRVLTFGLFYLLSQATVIAKLTFFSRFGWDVMEPITYFITFGTAVMSLIFFQYHKIEYSYPALAAMLTQRKARSLYNSYQFDIQKYIELQARSLQLERQLLTLQPPKSMLSTEEATQLSEDLKQVQEIRRSQEEQQELVGSGGQRRGKLQREPSFTVMDSY